MKSDFVFKKYSHSDIHQAYLAVGDDVEVRVRKIGTKSSLTLKIGSGKSRFEKEIPIPRKAFEALRRTSSYRVSKRRYRVPLNNLAIELDVFHGRLRGLKIAEIEFATERESEKFNPPFWLGKEITFDKRYRNSSLAIFGVPESK